MKVKKYTYTIADHFLPAIVNGDITGLEDNEEALLNGFLDSIYRENSHFATSSEESNFARCEVTGLHSNCVELEQIVMTGVTA